MEAAFGVFKLAEHVANAPVFGGVIEEFIALVAEGAGRTSDIERR